MTRKALEDDVDFIKALAEVLRSHDLAEIEVNRDYGEDSSLTVRIARATVAPAPAAPAQIAALPAAAAPAAASSALAASDPSEDPGTVASPMVGTAYLQPEPEANPFVKVGEVVAEGQTILIIEAMKTMNQIPAPRAGTVRRIFVDDGDPVEFGAPLMVIS